MKEIADNKNITSRERRILKFFFALTEGEKNVSVLMRTLDVSLSTARRYANILEKARIARIRNKDNRHGKSVVLCKNMYFSAVKIGKNTIDISIASFLPEYGYSVILPYNEAITDTENALCIKKTLKNLLSRLSAEKIFVAFVLSDGACIGENALRETAFNTFGFDELNSKILTHYGENKQNISTEDIISELVIGAVRNVRLEMNI